MRETVRYPRFLPVGDTAVSIEFGDSISPDVNALVAALDAALTEACLDGLIETVPSYRSLLACYDPVTLPLWRLVAEVSRLVGASGPSGRAETAWTVPVCYATPHAEDLPAVAGQLGLAKDDVAAMHAKTEFRVYALGFVPGMPYLGKLPEGLRIPRRENPRPSVPAGAVMIAGEQGLIMPVATPSGWHVIGRTPLKPFDPDRAEPFLFRTGDVVRFRPVPPDEFAHLAQMPHHELATLAREAA